MFLGFPLVLPWFSLALHGLAPSFSHWFAFMFAACLLLFIGFLHVLLLSSFYCLLFHFLAFPLVSVCFSLLFLWYCFVFLCFSWEFHVFFPLVCIHAPDASRRIFFQLLGLLSLSKAISFYFVAASSILPLWHDAEENTRAVGLIMFEKHIKQIISYDFKLISPSPVFPHPCKLEEPEQIGGEVAGGVAGEVVGEVAGEVAERCT